MFSLRSIEKYASWVRHVYIVTNGQIPNWLNLDSAYVTIIPHNEIYQNKSHLPTFSSPSIEERIFKVFFGKNHECIWQKDVLKFWKKCHLHEIRNLSEKFIYFNDDITFFNPICPEDYFEDENYKLYLNGKASGYPSGRGQGHMDQCPGILVRNPFTLHYRYRIGDTTRKKTWPVRGSNPRHSRY